MAPTTEIKLVPVPGFRDYPAPRAPLSAVEWAAVTKRRSARSGLLPRDQMRAWMSAAKAVGCVPVGVLGWTGLVVSSRYRRNARGLLACSV